MKSVTINRTGLHRARTRPEMTDYFTSTTVTSRIEAQKSTHGVWASTE